MSQDLQGFCAHVIEDFLRVIARAVIELPGARQVHPGRGLLGGSRARTPGEDDGGCAQQHPGGTNGQHSCRILADTPEECSIAFITSTRTWPSDVHRPNSSACAGASRASMGRASTSSTDSSRYG